MSDTKVAITDSGPYWVSGNFVVADADGNEFTVEDDDAYLCRCGQSDNKPFCDGSHNSAGFDNECRLTWMDGIGFRINRVMQRVRGSKMTDESGRTRIIVGNDDAYEIVGEFDFLDAEGKSYRQHGKLRVCRCGTSNAKPYCDNSHISTGFSSTVSATSDDE